MRASNLCNIYDCACTTIYLYAKKAPFPRPNTIQASDKEQKTRINPARIIRPLMSGKGLFSLPAAWERKKPRE